MNWLTRQAARRSRIKRQRSTSFRPLLELLEDRTVPSTVTWINSSSGDWADGSNWSTGSTPGPNDDVIISQAGITVTHSTGTDSINSLTLSDPLTISGGSLAIATDSTLNAALSVTGGSLALNGGTLGGTATLTNASGGTLTVTSSTINAALANQGTLLEQGNSTFGGTFSNAFNAILRVQGNDFTGGSQLTVGGFTNAGAVELTNVGSNTFSATLALSNNGTLTNTGSITTLGGSTPGGGRTLTALLNNQGTLTVDANGSTATTLNLAGTSTNSGTISVTGADLNLQNVTGSAMFSNAANGTITIAATRTMTIGSVAFPSFNAGTLSGGTYNIAGTLEFDNAAITTNAATVILDGTGAAAIVDQSNNNALANFATNNGSFTLQNGRALSTPAFTNAGSLTIDGGSSQLTTAGAYTQTAGSTTLKNGGTLTPAGAGVNLTAGALVGTGTIGGDLINSGTVNPGLSASAGKLTVTGAYTQNAGGTLNIKLGGTDPSAFDQLAVTGSAALGGTLNVTLIPGFTPTDGNSFQVLPCAFSTGDFATKTGFSLGGGIFLRENFASGVTLQAFQAQLLFQQQPTNTTAGQAISPAVTVAIVDPATNTPIAFDNSDTVTVSLNGAGTINGTLTQTVSGGVATFGNLSITQAASGYTLNANSASLAQVTSNTFAINPAAANHLLFLQQPTDTTAGQSITPAVQVEVLDQFNNVLTNDNSDTVTVSLNGAGTLNGTLTQTVSGGVATFGDLSINQAGAGNTLTASGAGLAPITSAAFAINPAAADHLVFLQQPTTTAAGHTISPAIVVAIVDQFGNVVTSDNTDTITVSISNNPSGGMLSGTLTVTVVNGRATFGDLSIDTAGSGYTLHATVGGSLPDIDSNPFDVTM
jgi:hypothetical protein